MTSKYGTTWIFSIEKAPWHNAIAERMIRSVKESLCKVIGKASLPRIELETLLVETEGIVNNRPLGLVSDDIKDSLPITLAELCIGRPIDVLPTPPTSVQSLLSHRRLLWKRLLNQFWKNWTNTYLLDLQTTRIWHTPNHIDVKIGEILLAREENLS